MAGCGGRTLRKRRAPTSPSPPTPTFLSTAFYGTIGLFSQEVPFGLLIATLLTGLLLLGMWLTPVSHSVVQQIAGSSQSAESKAPAIDRKMPEIEYVGRIVDMIDCKFSVQKAVTEKHKSEIKNRKSLVAIGDKLILDSGLMEIAYDTGAKVILQGPCAYRVEMNGGFLSVGKLIGKFEKKVVDKSGPQPLVPGPSSNPQSLIPNPFVISTPTAAVTDLGTEFGVEVDRAGLTQSYVFQGQVIFVVMNDGKAAKKTYTLGKNQSARTTTDRKTKNIIAVIKSAAAPLAGFVRELPCTASQTYAEMVLADRPLFYWTFDEPDGPAFEQVRHLAPQSLRPAGKAERCSHTAISSGLKLGRAADFSQAAGCFASSELGLKQGNLSGACAIEFLDASHQRSDRPYRAVYSKHRRRSDMESSRHYFQLAGTCQWQ